VEDLTKGIIKFNTKSTQLYPGLTKQEFLQSDLCSEVISEDEDVFSNYYLKPQKIGVDEFVVRVVFDPGDHISAVSLSLTTDGKIPSWDNWSEEEEMRIKDKHDCLLKRYLGDPPYKFDWGEITSNYDPRSASSQIIIRYYKEDN
jgi:hypothetical protein